jgi:hypothetical protein
MAGATVPQTFAGAGVEASAVASGLVSSDEPYVRLPERIELTVAEAGELLEVLGVAVPTARTDDERRAARTLRR